MVDFFDRFWIPQNDGVPDRNYLFVLIAIHIFGIVCTFIVHKIIRYRISNSMRGPAKDAIIEIPDILSKSLSLIYRGSILILLSNLITHVSGILGQYVGRENAYFLIGQEDLLWAIGFQIIVIGLYNFYHELTRVDRSDVIKFSPFILLILIIILIVVVVSISQLTTTNIEETSTTIGVFIFSAINISFIYKMIAYRNKGNNSPLIIYRKVVIFITTIITLIFFITLISLYIPYSDPLTQQLYYPTRHIEVEFLIMGGDLLILIVHIGLLFVIFPPTRLLYWIGITEQEYIKYADYRFDEIFSFERKIEELNEVLELHKPSEIIYILSFNKYERNVAYMLNEKYKGKIIDFSRLDEETLRKLVLPTSEIIFLDQSQSRNSQSIFGLLRREYAIDIVFDGEKVIFGSFIEYKSPEYKYALIVMIPSYWNYKRKFWHVNYHYTLRDYVTDFLIEYKTYLEELAFRNHLVLLLLRFPVYNGRISGIPSIRLESDIPDPRYIHFFKPN